MECDSLSVLSIYRRIFLSGLFVSSLSGDILLCLCILIRRLCVSWFGLVVSPCQVIG